jgi:hypothetical protein
MGIGMIRAYLGDMTTYTTPHFATGPSDRNVRSEQESLQRTRTAPAAPYRTAGVSNEATVLADGPTLDWQPGASKGVPKAAIGALGAALVGGVALAIVLLAPSNKVTKPVLPDPIAQAATQNAATKNSVDATEASVTAMDKQAPAAGTPATPAVAAVPAPAPVQAVIPQVAPVVNAPVAHVVRQAPVAAPRAAPQPVRSAPAVTPDVAPAVTPSVEVQPPAMQQTPETPTVTPSVPTPTPTPAPTQTSPDTPAPAPAQ